jgi:hypothetical protein
MRQQEAEQEAARRNAEDERRHRFLFYPLDHSAGMGDDAWEVEMRLRTAEEGALPAPVTVAASAPVERVRQPPPGAEAHEAPPVEALPPTEAFDALGPADPPEHIDPLEPADEDLAPAVRATELDEPPPPRARRRLRLIHVWGAFVILVGLLFIGATLLLSVVLRDYTHFGVIPTSIGIGLGLVAVWVGVALARTG